MKNKSHLTTVAVIFITTLLITGVIIPSQQAMASYENKLMDWGSRGHNVSIFASDLTNLGFNTYRTESILGCNSFNSVYNFRKVSGTKLDGTTGLVRKIVYTDKKNGGIAHQVQWGDSLYKIAARYGTTFNDIMSANNLSRPTIYVGEILIIPAARSITKHNVPDKPDNSSSAEFCESDCSDIATDN